MKDATIEQALKILRQETELDDSYDGYILIANSTEKDALRSSLQCGKALAMHAALEILKQLSSNEVLTVLAQLDHDQSKQDDNNMEAEFQKLMQANWTPSNN